MTVVTVRTTFESYGFHSRPFRYMYFRTKFFFYLFIYLFFMGREIFFFGNWKGFISKFLWEEIHFGTNYSVRECNSTLQGLRQYHLGWDIYFSHFFCLDFFFLFKIVESQVTNYSALGILRTSTWCKLKHFSILVGRPGIK